MTVSPGEYIKAVSTHDLSNSVLGQNVWYWKLESTGDVDYSDIMDTIETMVEAVFQDLDSMIWSQTELQDVIANVWEYDAQDGWKTGRLIGIRPLSDTFGNSTNMFPHAVAMTITGFPVDVRTRSRKSFGGFGENTANDSTVTASALTALGNVAVEWLTSQVISGSDVLEPGIPSLGGIWRPLLYALVSDITGSQKQRKPGIGI